MNKKSKRYIIGRNTKDVTIWPNFVLKLIGRIDAHKGEDVALAHIDRFLQKCVAIEDLECLISEEFLKKARSEGANLLDVVENISIEYPESPDDTTPEHTWEILEIRRRAAEREEALKAVRAARSRLYALNEEIVNGMSILEQRVSKIRKRAASKIAAYVKGVRAGGIPSFDPEVAFSTAAVDNYCRRHRRDASIAAIADASTNNHDKEEEEWAS